MLYWQDIKNFVEQISILGRATVKAKIVRLDNKTKLNTIKTKIALVVLLKIFNFNK